MPDQTLGARALFDMQMDCLKRDDRDAQMKLYDFIVAEFAFAVETDGNTVDFPFVQFFRTRDGKIAAVREYFSPRGRAEALGEG
jgi:ketosteroid isomerase-like protein